MLNHGRTLLLNRDAGVDGLGWPGDELIPAEFRPITLPSWLLNLRRKFFGTDPDRVFGNYRVKQLLAVLHATPLVDYLLELDPRVTYDPKSSEFFADSLFGVASPDANLHLRGDLGSPDSRGRSYHQWRIEVTGGDSVLVSRLSPPHSQVVYDYTIVDGRSSELSLPGSRLIFSFSEGIGQTWSLRGYARPSRSIADLASIISQTAATALPELFSVGEAYGREEPMRTFRNLWESHPDLPWRFGGLLLAYIYQAERLRG